MYSFIVCVLEEASSNYYRLKKIRFKMQLPLSLLGICGSRIFSVINTSAVQVSSG